MLDPCSSRHQIHHNLMNGIQQNRTRTEIPKRSSNTTVKWCEHREHCKNSICAHVTEIVCWCTMAHPLPNTAFIVSGMQYVGKTATVTDDVVSGVVNSRVFTQHACSYTSSPWINRASCHGLRPPPAADAGFVERWRNYWCRSNTT